MAVVADFKQLNPIVSGENVRSYCASWPTVVLETVYRSTDEEHLLFLNRIRQKQPTRDELEEYFHQRHWQHTELDDCIRTGEELAAIRKEPFTWLCVTNKGAAEVCQAALRTHGISQKDLDDGYLCDPSTKSDLRILARPGIMIRLSRNVDKHRGFVNGALARIVESLSGNAVFVAKLESSGNLVLVHPMTEDGAMFLPCCYGYATTIRRAQGQDLSHGCLYFNQRQVAVRGYGYVGVSRFRTRLGCYLYGKLRRTDFLPVGEEQADEVLQRGAMSEDLSSDEEFMPTCYQPYKTEADEEEYFDTESERGEVADYGDFDF